MNILKLRSFAVQLYYNIGRAECKSMQFSGPMQAQPSKGCRVSYLSSRLDNKLVGGIEIGINRFQRRTRFKLILTWLVHVCVRARVGQALSKFAQVILKQHFVFWGAVLGIKYELAAIDNT